MNAATDSCLDAKTLAAWADGSLSGAARDRALSHVADCRRCQTIVGRLARINTGLPAAAPQRVARGWWPWLAPLAAAAAALIAVQLWVRDVPRQTSEARPRAKEEVGVTELRSDAAASEPRKTATASPDPAAAASSSAIAAAPAGGFTLSTPRLKLGPPTGTTTGAPTTPTPGDIRSPDPAVRWRIAGSIVQRSINGGSTWRGVSTGFQGQLTTGSAPSSTVFWLVGGATVLLTADGGDSWRRVMSPERADLAAIRASDTRTASVATRDGRTFSTSDGGLTWVPASPQDF